MIDEATAKRAFLDALCWDEGDSLAHREGISPYLILFGGGSFENKPRDATGFPIWDGVAGPWGPNGEMRKTHAAGRAQFQPATWMQQAMKLKLTDFGPESQDRAAWDLAETVYNRSGGDLLKDCQARLVDMVAARLHSTWTSVQSGTFEARYRAALRGDAPYAPDPLPAPSIASAPPTLDAAVRALQTALGVEVDGKFGRLSLMALAAASPVTAAALRKWPRG